MLSDLASHLALGFSTALTPSNLFFCLIGSILGTLVGVLPGVGPVAALAMLLPLTFTLDPTGALIMLAGIFYGSQYGGSTTAILVNIPGESSSVVTTLDGFQMAQRGRAGAALATAALGSFFAGCIGTLLIAALGTPLTQVAILFGPAEYFSLMALGLALAVIMASGSVVRAVAMLFLGILLAMIGVDLETGAARMTFGVDALYDGIDFVPVAMGIFGLAEIMRNLETVQTRDVLREKISGLWLTRDEFRRATPAVLRGTALGSVLGILPGGGAVISAFASYALEKRISKEPHRFGKGAIEGVAGPESANNAAAQTSFIPLLSLGIPANAVMALMIGAMTIQGIQPGPNVLANQPQLYWGMIASMWLGNLMLLVINLPMVGIWVRFLKAPYRLLFPMIVVFSCIGVYSVNNSTSDVLLLAAFGVVGYVLFKLRFETVPLLLGFVLGPLLEENLRRAMALSRGDPSVFLTRPISATLLLITVALLILAILPSIRRKRDMVFVED